MLVCTCMREGSIATGNLGESVRLLRHSIWCWCMFLLNMSEASGVMFAAMSRGCGCEQQRWWPVGMIMTLLTARCALISILMILLHEVACVTWEPLNECCMQFSHCYVLQHCTMTWKQAWFAKTICYCDIPRWLSSWGSWLLHRLDRHLNKPLHIRLRYKLQRSQSDLGSA